VADDPAAVNGRDAHPGDVHEAHDPELIVVLLDPDPVAQDRAAALARIATCSACALLHADLIALAAAVPQVPIPARPRDFTLTAATAAKLASPMSGEPAAAGARLTGEMTRTDRHAAHDLLLIASLIDRSVSDPERVRAEEQLAACRDCATLFDDLVALSSATRDLPVPSRPRDFTLTPADASRLRVGGWRRLFAAIGSSRDAFSRPLAAGLTTLGLAGLLLATIPGAVGGLAGGATSLETVGAAVEDAARNGTAADPEMLSQASAAAAAPGEAGAASAAPAPAESGAPAAAAGPPGADTPSAEPDRLFEGSEQSPLAGEPDAFAPYDTGLSVGTPAGGWPMTVVAVLLLVAGLGLFGLRWTARRLGDG
jgi:hypothetical protein